MRTILQWFWLLNECKSNQFEWYIIQGHDFSIGVIYMLEFQEEMAIKTLLSEEQRTCKLASSEKWAVRRINLDIGSK